MKLLKLLSIPIIIFMTVSCNDSDDNKDNDKLTGVWEYEVNNELFLIIDNPDSLLISVCAAEGEPVQLMKRELENNAQLNIISSSEIELIDNSQVAAKLLKINDETRFDSGTFTLTSNNIEDVSSSVNVCAFRGKNNVRNTVSLPYLDSYIELVIYNYTETTGTFDLTTGEVSLSLESHATEIDSFSSFNTGTVSILEYTNEKLHVEYFVYDSSGNEYSGSVNVDI
jgi:hypothetical protein